MGVACKWGRSASIDMVTMGLPGLIGKWRNLRTPLCAIDHAWVGHPSTFDDLLEAITWSLRHCALGTHPLGRHDHVDGQPWKKSDQKRAKLAGQARQVAE